ncbi:hypothetical protein EI200_07445 [Peribacillus simplex]|nr:hypothetical protein EI200_07445 [Peribacillus simplex]
MFHLDAIYDLVVPEKIDRLANVVGTEHVNEFAKGVTNLKRYTYFSNRYVAGNREGILTSMNCAFRKALRIIMNGQNLRLNYLSRSYKEIPITIIRPRIVKGHSQTGETIKLDGRYFILNFLDPYISSEREMVVNLVTIDYIIQATLSLALYNEGRENLSFN